MNREQLPENSFTHELESLRRELAIARAAEAEQYRVELELLQAKERAELLCRVVPSAIFTVDTDRRITSWNNKAAEITGYSEAEAIGKECNLFAVSPCSHLCGLFAPEVEKPAIGGECTIRCKDGQVRAVRKNVDLLRDADGAVVGGVESFEDVTERKQSEDALSESETRYRVLMESMDDAVHLRDASGRFIMVNSATARRLGMEKEQILGKTPAEIHHPEVAQMILDADSRVFRTGEPVDAVEVFPHRSHAQVCHVRKVPIHNDGGEVVGVLTVSRDITERRRFEDALNKERDFTSAIIDTVGSLVLVMDRKGRIVRFNRACERTTGYQFEEVKGGDPLELFLVPEEVADVSAMFQRLIAGQFPINHENHWRTREGGLRLIAWTNTLLFDSEGRVEYVVSAGTDITDQRRAEEALRHSNEQLTGWVAELERRNEEDRLLNEMSDLLQTCLTLEDAYSVVAHSAQRLFPGTVGSLYVISASRNLVDSVATWGDFPMEERVFSPDDCWGLRRGRIHVVSDPSHALKCQHLHQPLRGPSFCVPMAAQGNTLGILHLRIEGQGDSERGAEAVVRPRDGQQKLIEAASERIGLALANLRLRETLRAQAIHDLLTGLFNRRYMEEMLEREISRAIRRQTAVGIIMMDIDHFKQFNDLFGHEAGDALLAGLGSYLRNHTRGEDIACRYGGEEFTLILPDASLEATLARAEEMREGIGQLTVEHRGLHLGPITVSMGVAAFPLHGRGGEEVLRAADMALYLAKSEGRDRVVAAP